MFIFMLVRTLLPADQHGNEHSGIPEMQLQKRIRNTKLN